MSGGRRGSRGRGRGSVAVRVVDSGDATITPSVAVVASPSDTSPPARHSRPHPASLAAQVGRAPSFALKTRQAIADLCGTPKRFDILDKAKRETAKTNSVLKAELERQHCTLSRTQLLDAFKWAHEDARTHLSPRRLAEQVRLWAGAETHVVPRVPENFEIGTGGAVDAGFWTDDEANGSEIVAFMRDVVVSVQRDIVAERRERVRDDSKITRDFCRRKLEEKLAACPRGGRYAALLDTVRFPARYGVLAEVVRARALAPAALDPDLDEVTFDCERGFALRVPNLDWQRHTDPVRDVAVFYKARPSESDAASGGQGPQPPAFLLVRGVEGGTQGTRDTAPQKRRQHTRILEEELGDAVAAIEEQALRCNSSCDEFSGRDPGASSKRRVHAEISRNFGCRPSPYTAHGVAARHPEDLLARGANSKGCVERPKLDDAAGASVAHALELLKSRWYAELHPLELARAFLGLNAARVDAVPQRASPNAPNTHRLVVDKACEEGGGGEDGAGGGDVHVLRRECKEEQNAHLREELSDKRPFAAQAVYVKNAAVSVHTDEKDISYGVLLVTDVLNPLPKKRPRDGHRGNPGHRPRGACFFFPRLQHVVALQPGDALLFDTREAHCLGECWYDAGGCRWWRCVLSAFYKVDHVVLGPSRTDATVAAAYTPTAV